MGFLRKGNRRRRMWGRGCGVSVFGNLCVGSFNCNKALFRVARTVLPTADRVCEDLDRVREPGGSLPILY